MLKTHNMNYLVGFPNRIKEGSETAIDNLVVKNIDGNSISVEALITCLSDHDQQLHIYVNISQ